jgi:hypothetical protein
VGIGRKDEETKDKTPWKFQIPSTKFQINSNEPNSKLQTKLFRSLEIGIWKLFGICNLEFSINSLRHICS